jgi:beta-lactamase regulating signal transducer with metallopeptidase domain
MATTAFLSQFGLNLVLASVLSIAVAYGLSFVFRSLPKQYASMVVGLIACLLSPFIVGLATNFSLGILPALEEASIVELTSVRSQPLPTEIVDFGSVEPARSPIAELPNLELIVDHAATEANDENKPKTIGESRQRESVALVSKTEADALDSSAPLNRLSQLSVFLLFAWLLGSSVFGLRLLRSCWLCRRFLKQCKPVVDQPTLGIFHQELSRLGIARLPLLKSQHLPSPVVAGWIFPSIVLPSDIQRILPPEQLRGVLAHELSHIQRRDHWAILAQAIAIVLYWWNPILHLMSRRLNAVREMICDDIATSTAESGKQVETRTNYAHSLLQMTERAVEYRYAASSLGVSLSSLTEMERRMHRILSKATGPIEIKLSRYFCFGMVAFASVLAVGMTFAQISTPKDSDQEEKPNTSSEAAPTNAREVSTPQKLGRPDGKPQVLSGKVLDASGNPQADSTVHVSNRFDDIEATTKTDSDGQYRFEIMTGGQGIFASKILARSANGALIGYGRAAWDVTQVESHQVDIRLETARKVHVQVIDQTGQPIREAKVAIQLQFPNMLGPVLTDSEGMASLSLPQSETIQSVLAWKDGQGMDFRDYQLPRGQVFDRLTPKPEFPSDDREVLTLDGAAPLKVVVSDSQNQPIPGAETYVWLLRKDNRDDSFNLSYFGEYLTETSNEAGEVNFPWFPAWQKEQTTIWTSVKGFERNRGEYVPSTMAGRLKIQLERLIPLRGSVKYPDGKPASKIQVRASGDGYSIDRFYESAVTDENGRYEFMAVPNQIYMLGVFDQAWSAPAQSGFAVLPGKEVEDHDFILSPATRVFGQVLHATSGKPLTDQSVYFTQHGIDLNSMGSDILPNPTGSRSWVCPMLQLNARSDNEGKFEFLVGDGDYNLFIQGSAGTKLTVRGDREKVVDLQIDLKIELESKAILRGAVVDDESNEPVADAYVKAHLRNFQRSQEWQAGTTSEGKFEIERPSLAAYMFVTDKQRTRGMIQEIDAKATEVAIRLKKLGTAKGRLMSEDGSTPAAGVKLLYGVTISDENNRLSTSRFGKIVTTDADGNFTFTEVVPNWEYDCTLHEHPTGFVLNVTKFQVKAGETLELGEVKTPEAPKPSIPPSLTERIEDSFDVEGTPTERFSKAKRVIKNVNQNLLVVFGEPTSEKVKSLMQIRFQDRDFQPYRDDFRIMAIPTDAARLEAAKELAKELEITDLGDGRQLHLVVIDHDGNVQAKLAEAQLSLEDAFSKALFLDELDKYKTK